MLSAPAMFESGSVVLGCLVWIPIAIWVMSLVGWTIQGDVDFLTGIVGVAMGIVLGVLTMNPPRKELSPLLFTAVLLTVVFFPLVRAALNKRALDRLDVEAMENVYTALRLRPDNHALRFKLARLIYVKGLRGHAFVIAKEALKHMPASMFIEEHRVVNSWSRVPPQPDLMRPLPCIECGTMNAAGNLFCTRCFSPFLMDHSKGRWIGKGHARKLMAVWAAVMAGLVGVPFASALLAPVPAIVVIILLLAATGFVMVLAFLPDRKGVIS